MLCLVLFDVLASGDQERQSQGNVGNAHSPIISQRRCTHKRTVRSPAWAPLSVVVPNPLLLCNSNGALSLL